MRISRARVPEEGVQRGQSATEEQDSQGEEVGEEGSEEKGRERAEKKMRERRGRERGEKGGRERAAGSLSNTPSKAIICLGNSSSTLEDSFTTQPQRKSFQ